MNIDPTRHDEAKHEEQVSAARIRRTTALFVFLMFAAPIGVPFSLLAIGGLTTSEVAVRDPFGEVEPNEVGTDFNSVNLWFQITDFDPERLTAKLNTYPWPSDDLATPFSSSTSINDTPIRVWIDELYGQSLYTFEANTAVGAINSELDVLSYDHETLAHDNFYPFDEYVLDTYASSESSVKSENGENVYTPIKTFDFFYTNPLPGFQITFERKSAWSGDLSPSTRSEILDEREKGLVSFTAKFSRSAAVKAIAIMMGLFCVLSSASLSWITTRIWLKKRPPSMQALVWAAATVLGTIQLREILPGKPRLGIIMDFVFFFPSLLTGMVSSLLITAYWIKREDFAI